MSHSFISVGKKSGSFEQRLRLKETWSLWEAEGRLLVKEDLRLKEVAEERGTKCTSAITKAPNLDTLSTCYYRWIGRIKLDRLVFKGS